MELSCHEMSKIIQQDSSPQSWREFQEEIRKNKVLTGAGIQQVLAGALQSRVEEIERRASERDAEGIDGESDDDIDPIAISSSWSESFLPFSAKEGRLNKRGTMNMLMSGLGEEVEGGSTHSPRRVSFIGSASPSTTPATPVNRRVSFIELSTPTIKKSTLTTVPPSSSARRVSFIGTSTSPGSKKPTTSLNTSGHAPRRVSLAQNSNHESDRRRPSMFANMMSDLTGEKNYSMSQALSNGSYINRNNAVDFVSTAEYTGVIHRREDDSERAQCFQQTDCGLFLQSRTASYFSSAVDSAIDTAKSFIEGAKTA
jgi:hypothetical protein